ncbi:MAG TPA: aminopeptidase [Cyclobacteriaceae bacterium]|nr:aminopeptidase [Cyclobacteriaceae bacterium]
MKRMFKKVLWILLLLAAVLFAVFHELVFYGIAQGKGQLGIIWKAKPITYYLNDPSFPDTLKQKLHFIEEVKQFAIDSLGLAPTKNYSTLYDQQGKDIMWVVTAAKPFALEPKEWKFPVVGSVPYKGFFNQEKALKLAEELKADGWDVDIKIPGAWSTLGWFRDPILSKMLLRSEGDLASLIIHEMVHATIFVKDSIEFNENLASFIGDLGAFHFLESNYGRSSTYYQQYEREETDFEKFVDHMLRGADELQKMYAGFNADLADSIKYKRKSLLINEIVTEMDTLSLITRFQPSVIFKNKQPNNAYFMSFIRYRSLADELNIELMDVYNGDIKMMINAYKERFPFL